MVNGCILQRPALDAMGSAYCCGRGVASRMPCQLRALHMGGAIPEGLVATGKYAPAIYSLM